MHRWSGGVTGQYPGTDVYPGLFLYFCSGDSDKTKAQNWMMYGKQPPQTVLSEAIEVHAGLPSANLTNTDFCVMHAYNNCLKE